MTKTTNMLDLEVLLEKAFIPSVWTSFCWRCKKTVRRWKKFRNWFPIIWNDHDWDPIYFYAILAQKLKDMEIYYLNADMPAVDTAAQQGRIQICRVLAERLRDGYYNLQSTEELDRAIPDFFRGWPGKAHTKRETRLFHNIVTRWDRHEQFDKEYLFTQITKYIDRWWD